MNVVTLTGKIISIKRLQKVNYVTVLCKDGKNSEFIDVTIFDKKFFDRYFTTGQWISIQGRLHKNKQRNYNQDVIAENIYFCGNITESFEEIDEPNPFDSLPPKEAVS